MDAERFREEIDAVPTVLWNAEDELRKEDHRDYSAVRRFRNRVTTGGDISVTGAT